MIEEKPLKWLEKPKHFRERADIVWSFSVMGCLMVGFLGLLFCAFGPTSDSCDEQAAFDSCFEDRVDQLE